jgi:Cdc6-like AAA superfamily ATPase
MMSLPMNLRSEKFVSAIGALERRAERQDNDLTLYNTYVDCGVLAELSDTESQVIYGRRGVGKTHLLHFHRHRHSLQHPRCPYIIFDCQRLGSGTATVSDDPKIIGRNYAFELLNDLATRLFSYVDTLRLDKKNETIAQCTIMTFVEHIVSKDGSFDLRNLSSTFRAFCDTAEIKRVFIALDEFVSVPQRAQPIFAHILKQIFASDRRVVFKIAAVTFQTSLYAEVNGQPLGMEIGADVFSDIDLDSYFLWDENKEAVMLFFSQVLYNHLGEFLEWDLAAKPELKRENIISWLFTQEKCLQELVRASEGNARDFLNILRLAYSEFRRSSGERIGIDHVTTAAKTWYKNAKLANLSSNTRDEEFLNALIQDVIKNRKSRSFMVSYQDARHPLLIRLLNLRLLHRMRTTWTHPDKPGEPYHIFTIDYGCYAELKGTRTEPSQYVFFGEQEPPMVDDGQELVPLPDRRSIRRIVIHRDFIDKFYVP